ncbi:MULTISPECIES: DNA repair protein RecN [unclassified Enterococcus]|uniref:DNA repair protein RecN n=1 Tax=unclassified Enterococcus TaxID=2608891 RepID=UPI0015563023|nr:MULTISPECIES: DNA repair protein RecN [unclassified Enterococcus]MBS7575991.1 DNA repair protein RecN [Enterococcus sp. MMGLQ5-2]MBS7583224.1 DNA repair protein RecN [Enterococcus sp. MMGLQ5-1]NPD11084.1 DNA repair protein RecN [Enterococcus sp. MMGLQ5-1]NPD35827.1 DNA repair protein RecN [Enterococcus sp. MMGLQ5-2]
MLLELSIKNFAIIKSVTVPFEAGMTVLTGETGAGKSIIIDAMNLLLGSRASSDFIRHGEDKAEIEGLFAISLTNKLADQLYLLGIELDEAQLIVKREIYRTGRSICRINGHLVTLTNLKEIGGALVDVHGQHEHQELMQQAHHIELLDQFGNQNFKTLKSNYQTIFYDYAKLHKQMVERQNNQVKFNQRLHELKASMAEIGAANLEVGEEELLRKKRLQLQNQQTIVQQLLESLNILQNEDFSPNDLLGQVGSKLNQLSDFDPDYPKLLDQIAILSDGLSEIANQLENKLDQFDYQDESLDEIEERLSLIGRLERQYGETIPEILDYYQAISEEYDELQAIELADSGLQTKAKALKSELVSQGDALNVARRKIATALEQEIEQQFKELYLEKAKFQVVFSKAKYSVNGNERVEFFVSMNPGEGFKPLAKTASGGELSRIMLALKAIFTNDTQTAIVFDEVDTGVSGRVAQAIANKIHKISAYSQVLCISHLPQVAAIADFQYFIEKVSDGHSTETRVKVLSFEERVNEVARMLAGETVTELTLEHAKELLMTQH